MPRSNGWCSTSRAGSVSHGMTSPPIDPMFTSGNGLSSVSPGTMPGPLRDHMRVEDPVIVIARHALGPRLGARRPADGQHLAADGRMRGDIGAHTRRIGLCHFGPEVAMAVTEQSDLEPQLAALPGVIEAGKGRHRHHQPRLGLRGNERKLMHAILHHHRRHDQPKPRAGKEQQDRIDRVGQLRQDHIVLAQAPRQQRRCKSLGPVGDLVPAQSFGRPSVQRLAIERVDQRHAVSSLAQPPNARRRRHCPRSTSPCLQRHEYARGE